MKKMLKTMMCVGTLVTTAAGLFYFYKIIQNSKNLGKEVHEADKKLAIMKEYIKNGSDKEILLLKWNEFYPEIFHLAERVNSNEFGFVFRTKNKAALDIKTEMEDIINEIQGGDNYDDSESDADIKIIWVYA